MYDHYDRKHLLHTLQDDSPRLMLFLTARSELSLLLSNATFATSIQKYDQRDLCTTSMLLCGILSTYRIPRLLRHRIYNLTSLRSIRRI
jgi:hypothetical protein